MAAPPDPLSAKPEANCSSPKRIRLLGVFFWRMAPGRSLRRVRRQTKPPGRPADAGTVGRCNREGVECLVQYSGVSLIYEVRRLVASFQQAMFLYAFLNAFWNAFSKSFTSSKAPISCAIATKRLWRSASVTLGLASNLRIMLRNPARTGKIVASRAGR